MGPEDEHKHFCMLDESSSAMRLDLSQEASCSSREGACALDGASESIDSTSSGSPWLGATPDQGYTSERERDYSPPTGTQHPEDSPSLQSSSSDHTEDFSDCCCQVTPDCSGTDDDEGFAAFVVNKVEYPSSVYERQTDHNGFLSGKDCVLYPASLNMDSISEESRATQTDMLFSRGGYKHPPDPPLVIKSVLKKRPHIKKNRSRRVTFDEAVSFYCDDYPEIRFLALRSSEVSYADLYFMFDPPPEYQDWNPCDPPVEYQDRSFIPPPPVRNNCTFDLSSSSSASTNHSSRNNTWQPTETARDEWDGYYGDRAAQASVIKVAAAAPAPAPAPPPPKVEKVKPAVVVVVNKVVRQEPKVVRPQEPSRNVVANNVAEREKEAPYLPDIVEECSTSFNDYNEIEEGLLDELRKGETNEDISCIETELAPAQDISYQRDPEQQRSCDETHATIIEEDEEEEEEEAAEEDPTPEKDIAAMEDLVATNNENNLLKKQESEQSEISELDLELEIIAKEEEERVHSELSNNDETSYLEDTNDPESISEALEDMNFEMSRTSSQIRKYFEENAMTCSILRGIEARRRDEKRFSRPKSPLPSRDSLVEQLRRLTATDEDDGNITGEDDDQPDMSAGDHTIVEEAITSTVLPNNYQEVHVTQVTHIKQAFSPYMPSPNNNFHPPIMPPYAPSIMPPQAIMQPGMSQEGHPLRHDEPQYIETERVTTHIKNDTVTTTVNKTFKTNRFKAHFEQTLRRHLADGFRRSGNENQVEQTVHMSVRQVETTHGQPPATNASDELERFVQQDIERIQRIKKRYSMAEEDEDPTFGFARRPSVRGIRNRFGSTTEILQQIHTQMSNPPLPPRNSAWHRINSFADCPPQQQIGKVGSSSSGMVGYKPQYVPRDHRYYSQGDNLYGTMSNLIPSLWSSRDRRSAFLPLPEKEQSHCVPTPHLLPQSLSKDERGTPEGASSTPQVSSDSIYSIPSTVQQSSNSSTAPTNGPTLNPKGVIYYSMNV